MASGDWVSPKSAAVGDLFDVKWDYSGTGAPSGLADDTYGQINTDRQWLLTQIGTGSASNTGAVSVRLRSSGVVQDTCSASLSVTVTA